jgi:beta-lactamase class C
MQLFNIRFKVFRWVSLSAFLLVCIFPILGNAETGDSPIATLLSRFEKSENLKKLQALNGAIAIVYKNEIIYKSVFGFRNNKREKITSSTLFSLASASKPISATLVAHLVKQKKLSFDDPIHPVVIGLDSRILLKHLLSHSSGYMDHIGNKSVESGQSREQLVHLFGKKEINHPPGSRYSYSNVLFSLLENLIQQKTHSTYIENMTKFLTQIGMQGESVCDLNPAHLIAYPHRMIKNKLISRNLPKLYTESVCSAAGLFLSIDQMANYANFMLGHNPQILDKKELDLLFQPQVEVTDIFWKWHLKWPFPVRELKSHYGLGWRTLEWKNNMKDRLIFHGGHLNGVSTFIGLLPEKDLGIVILSNQDALSGDSLGMDFWKYSMDFLVSDSLVANPKN